MKVFSPPKMIDTKNEISIFLAGTIDMGESENWQGDFIATFKSKKEVVFLNPRRASWDNSWEQNFESPYFYQQVNWELNALEKSTYIVLNLLPQSKSPISLLELGLFAKSGKLWVCCPDNFYRSGNVQIVCDKYNIPLYKDIETLKINLQNVTSNN